MGRLRRAAVTGQLAAASFVLLATLPWSGLAADTDDDHAIFVETDAHEGPVAVPALHRIYFTTKPDLQADEPHVAIGYVDVSTGDVGTLAPRSNMANSMWLSADGQTLLVAEQGTLDTPGAISRIDVSNGYRTVLVDEYDGQRFNSPNKVIEADTGWIYFSDPDYGHNQGFKPPPELPMAVYAHDPATGTTTVLTDALDRPHGLALSPDQSVLYITDTDAIDGKNPYDPNRTRAILAAPLLAPDHLGPIETIATVPVGIPDGLTVTAEDGHLWVGAGDGLRRYTPDGDLVELFPVGGGVFNVTRFGDSMYSTADTAIWKTAITADP
ncbi:MAG: SMP-30/gluconolactonase/LRE family protein [Actinomycetota bacterium]